MVRSQRSARSASDFSLSPSNRRSAPRAGATAAELLTRAPGLHVSQHSGAGKAHQIFLRGFDALHGQDLEISVGGIGLNETGNIHGQGYADLTFLPPEAVWRMRVLEGPFDPRQGDFAVAGSVEIEPGLVQRGVLARATVGSYGLYRALLGWGPEGQPEETFVLAELAQGDGFGPSRAWRRGNALGQAVVPLGRGFKLRLFGTSHAGRFSSAGVLREEDLRNGTRGFFDTYDDGQGGSTARHQALVEVGYSGEATKASLGLFAVVRELRLRHNFTGFLVTPEKKVAAVGANDPQGDLQEQQNDTLSVGGRAQIRRSFSLFWLSHGFEAGVLFRHDRVEQAQRRLRAVDQQPWRGEVDASLGITELGLYLDLDLALPVGLGLRVGLRGDALAFDIEDHQANAGQGSRREAFGLRLGPKATLHYRPHPALQLFASYGNGFRSPQPQSLGQGESAPFTTIHAGELGGRLRLGRTLDATLSGFVTQVGEDLLFDHASGQTLAKGETLRTGVTAMLESRPLPWLHGLLSATWSRAIQVETGEELPYAPTLVGRLDLDAQQALAVLWGRPLTLFGDLGLGVVGPRPLPYGERSRTVALLDLGAGLELRPATLSLEVSNLADVRTRDGEFVYASSFRTGSAPSLVPARHFTAGSPLTIQGTLTLLF